MVKCGARYIARAAAPRQACVRRIISRNDAVEKGGARASSPQRSVILPDALNGVAHNNRASSATHAHSWPRQDAVAYGLEARAPHLFPWRYFASFAQLSLSVMTRLKTGRDGFESMGSRVM